MELGNWDDEDEILPARAEPGPSNLAEMDDLFDFTDSLRLDAPEEDPNEPKKELPPLPAGVEDLTDDRGVLLQRRGGQSKGEKPSKEEQFVEMHYEGFLVSSGEKFDSSRDQNYAMVVQLDIPPSGKSTIIRGLEVGLRELSEGNNATLTIQSRYAYGKEGTSDIPPDSDLRFEIEVLHVRSTNKRITVVDTSKKDLSRLEDIRLQREMDQQRREDDALVKDAEKKTKPDRAAMLRQKLANKHKGKKGKKKK